MNSPHLNSLLSTIYRRATVPRKILWLSLMTCALTARAQPVVAPPPAVSYVPAALPQAPVSESTPPTALGSSPFAWGVVTLHPHFSYRFLYGDGIQANPGQRAITSIHALSPGVLLDIGTHWTLDYTPTQTYYSNSAFKDTLDNAVRLQGGTTFEDWTFQVSQTYVSSSTPLIETARQTNQDTYGTAASALYRFGHQLQLDTSLSYQARFPKAFPSSKESTLGERLHYQFSPHLDSSVNLDFGYVNMSLGSDMSYTRPALQINWKATDKISFDLQGGFENRKFRTGGAKDLNSPTFGASIQYQPFTTTTVSIAANRGVTVSYFTSQITRSTSWTLNFQQRLLQHYYLSAGYSGQDSTYVTTDPTVAAGRADRSNSFNVRVTTTFFQRATFAILYQNSHNNSNNTGFGYTSSQVGFELGYRY